MNYLILITGLMSAWASTVSAENRVTHRINQFTNNKVAVWNTIIYPSSHNALTMHRHERDRVLIALNDGLLKITNNKANTHYLKLEKNKAYFLTKDVPGELHNDINVGNKPLSVMVIELNDRFG